MQHVLNVGGGGRDAFDSRRAPRYEEYGVWITATRSLPGCSIWYTKRRQ